MRASAIHNNTSTMSSLNNSQLLFNTQARRGFFGRKKTEEEKVEPEAEKKEEAAEADAEKK